MSPHASYHTHHRDSKDPQKKTRSILHHEAFPGFLLLAGAILAIIIANSPFGEAWNHFLHSEQGIEPLKLSVHMWIQDGLMAIFFLFVSLELKRELVAGVLANPKHAALPIAASLGGTIVPALIYTAFNLGSYAGDMNGWAIPSATDIAFSLGVLSLFGDRVPNVLKIFLLALAIVDDMAAVLIIAFGYTQTIVADSLGIAMALFGVMFLLNRMNITRLSIYWFLGAWMWFVLLHSGIHATIAGVLTAFAIPVGKGRHKDALLLKAEHALRPWVQLGIMPLYALAFAGFHFSSINMAALAHPVTLGVLFGLLIGKPLGVIAACVLFRRATRAKLHIPWPKLWGVGFLSGIGFTMSLFIGGLAFSDETMREYVLMGVYAGSILSAVIGCVILSNALPRKRHSHAKSAASDFLTGH